MIAVGYDNAAELTKLLHEVSELQAQRGDGKLPYFALYTEDFYRGTRKFTREERDVYLELLTCQWNADGRGLPGVEDMADMISMKPEKFARIWERKLQRKFMQLDGRYYNFRCEQVRKEKLSAGLRATARARSKHAAMPADHRSDAGAAPFG